ncbi:MAG: LytTR family transcriptional regulator DNA-binding domain-containing protein [Oscillospiraceae bacterium]|nr:LytTR family transcriptional regulator DNA-binding domain-containing protein [Oscillospiraceae bacterium]
MKIIIETPNPGEEEEVIIRCQELDDDLLRLINQLKSGKARITGYQGSMLRQLLPKEIYYFESVDNKVFAYCEQEVFEVKEKLYEIEARFQQTDFLRISKSVIVNVSLIESIAPMLGSRLEATMQNSEKVIISRQYVPELKKKLGIAER